VSAPEMGSMIRSWSRWRFGKVLDLFEPVWCSSVANLASGRSLRADPLTVDVVGSRGAAVCPACCERRRLPLLGIGGGLSGGGAGRRCGRRRLRTHGAGGAATCDARPAIDDVSHDPIGSKHLKRRITGPWERAA
jgi:hypothetical protein